MWSMLFRVVLAVAALLPTAFAQAQESGDEEDPYVVTPTIAPGVSIDGKPINPVWINVTTDPKEQKSPFDRLDRFSHHIKNAFSCPFATCTEDVIVDEHKGGYPWGQVLLGVLIIGLIAGLAHYLTSPARKRKKKKSSTPDASADKLKELEAAVSEEPQQPLIQAVSSQPQQALSQQVYMPYAMSPAPQYSARQVAQPAYYVYNQ
eukprot:TRINITY_DN109175_c0_g1_i1.p1 TRINITY_DN109175_c0_g1~~TRINITY_DN109175_c0_g1_i1.p1  ORF type:complete len:223 (-),score=33.10 TRINITY_DN109175_c0_g1_i1:46-660(-)